MQEIWTSTKVTSKAATEILKAALSSVGPLSILSGALGKLEQLFAECSSSRACLMKQWIY